MADRYWVGGTGAWSGTNTANWSTSDGGSSGASVPTSVDNVFFTALSNTGTGAFTVTMTTVDGNCANFDSTGIDGVMTIASRTVNVYGNMALGATMVNNNTDYAFRGTGGAQTVNTNGVTLANVTFVSGTYTLQAAFACAQCLNTGSTFNTNNFNMTLTGNLSSTGAIARTYNFGSSTITLTGSAGGVQISGSNFTHNFGTSKLVFANIRGFINAPSTTNFYDVEMTFDGSSLHAFDLASFTCRNLTFKAFTSGPQRLISLAASSAITVTGTFTCEANATRILRTALGPDPAATLSTYVRGTINAASYSLNDIDIFTVAFGGAGIPVTGTSIGDSGNTTNVTFTASKTVYKTSASTFWIGNTWALSSGGSVALDNYPLPQDTIIIDNNSGASITTSGLQYAACQTFDATARTTTFTATIEASTALVFGGDNGGLASNANLVLTTTARRILFSGTGTQSITSPTSYATSSIASLLIIYKLNGGDFRLNSNLTTLGSIALLAGGFDLNGFTFKCSGYQVLSAYAKTLTYGFGGLIECIPVLGIGFCFTFTNATAYTVNADTVTGLRPLLVSGSVPTLTLTGFMDLSPVGITEANGHDLTVTASHTGASYFSFTGRHLNLAAYTTSGAAGQAQNMTLFGDFILGSGITSFTNSGSTITFASTSATERVLTSAGENCTFAINFNGVGGRWRFTDNWSCNQTAQTLTVTAGTLNLNGFTVTMPQIAITGTTARAITFGGGKIVNFSNNGTSFFASNFTNLVFNDTSRFEFTYAGATGTRTIQGPTSGATTANKLNVYVTAGTDIIASSANAQFYTLDLTGFSGILGSPAFKVSNFVVSATMTTTTAYTNNLIYTGYAGESYNINWNGKQFNRPFNFDGVGCTFNLTSNLDLDYNSIFSRIDLTNGTLNLGTFTIRCPAFFSNVSNVRTLAFGAGGKFNLWKDSITILDTQIMTNLTVTGTSRFECTYSGATGTRVVLTGTSGGATATNKLNIYVMAGTDIFSPTASNVFNGIIDYTGFSGTLGSSARTYNGNIIYSPTMTFTSTPITTFAGYSGETATIQMNGKTNPGPITFNTAGSTWVFASAFTGTACALTHTAGTIDFASYNITIDGAVTISGAGVKQMIFGTTNFTTTATGTAWNASGSNFTTTYSLAAQIRLTPPGAIAKQFQGGGFSYPTLYNGNGGMLSIGGANTFSSWKGVSGVATSWSFPAATTQTFLNNFELRGTAGNLVTLQSIPATSVATLSKASGVVDCDYLNISYNTATGGAAWYAGANSTNGGNNTGWIFSAAPVVSQTGQFFELFDWA